MAFVGGFGMLGPAGSFHLPEFSNPAGQTSRTLVFAAILYGMKAVRDSKRVELATPLERRRAA